MKTSQSIAKVPTTNYVQLDSGRYVPRSLYLSVMQQVREILPAMRNPYIYSLKVLCGPDYWDPLSRKQRILAGWCMGDIVQNKLLPLQRMTSGYSSAMYALV